MLLRGRLHRHHTINESIGVDVKFKDQGLEAIEVSDNGSGVHESNYASLGKTMGFLVKVSLLIMITWT